MPADVICHRCLLSSSVVVCNTGCMCNVTHQEAAHDSAPVLLRPVRVTPCLNKWWLVVSDVVEKNWLIVKVESLASSKKLRHVDVNTGTQEGYWTKASRPVYPDLDCRCGAESTSFREVEPWSHTETPGMPNVHQDDYRMTIHSVRWQHHPATYSIVRLLSQWMSTFCNSDVIVVGTTSRCDLWYSDRCTVVGMELLRGHSIHGVSCIPRSCEGCLCEGVGVIVEKIKQVDELSTKILAIYLQQ